MDASPSATGSREALAIPAHRDPVEYLRSLEERERRAEPRTTGQLPAVGGHRRKSNGRLVALLAVCGLAVAFAVVGVLALQTPGEADDAGATPRTATNSTINSTRVESVAPILPTAGTIMATEGLAPSVHRVVVGDTLSSIAVQFGTTVEELIALNDLRDANQIVVGMILRLPTPANAPGD